jgi:hypothetical protein
MDTTKFWRVRRILFAAALLASTLACRFVTQLFLPDTTTPPSAPIAEPPAEAPIAEPELDASCYVLLNEILQAATSSGDPGEEDSSEAEVYLVTYGIQGDSILDPAFEAVTDDLLDEQQDTAAHEQIWEYFTALIPPERRLMLVEYSVISDGEGRLLAAVAQTTTDADSWALEVDIADSYNQANLTYTLVHEFGHLLTLNAGQVIPSLALFYNPDDNETYTREVAACPDYFPGEGCSQPDSYINAFFNQFWKDIHADWQKVNLEEDDDLYYEKLDEFYTSHADQFVNDYAVTNPEEDIAESWSFFVLGPRLEGKTIAEEKILFFYRYPELVQLRSRILSRLCTAYPGP